MSQLLQILIGSRELVFLPRSDKDGSLWFFFLLEVFMYRTNLALVYVGPGICGCYQETLHISPASGSI
jgi:hypothetical protein